jgi:hypothetical protein
LFLSLPYATPNGDQPTGAAASEAKAERGCQQDRQVGGVARALPVGASRCASEAPPGPLPITIKSKWSSTVTARSVARRWKHLRATPPRAIGSFSKNDVEPMFRNLGRRNTRDDTDQRLTFDTFVPSSETSRSQSRQQAPTWLALARITADCAAAAS